MSATAHDLRKWHALIRDLRHMDARAAPDLADWLVRLELEGKADRTLYEYVRKLAPLLRAYPEKATADFTAQDIELVLARVPKRSRHISRSIINRFFIWAEMHDRTPRSPMGKVATIRHPAHRIRDIFTVTEVGLPDVDCWDEARDARLYAGPWPVVAHPPCARWGSLAYVNQSMHGYLVGDDGGCFEAALTSVRTFGGVLEHPANSIAWSAFGLPRPAREGWARSFDDAGWATEVSQVSYGHRARKRTWLYYVGANPPPELDWRDADGECIVGDLWHGDSRRQGRGDRPRMYQREALATPPAFRDVLLEMAQSAQKVAA